MTRETEFNFANLPETEIGRSKFDRSFNHATTFSNGNLIPIMVEHVMPGDTVNMDVSAVIRMLTPMTPVMDNLYADIFFFYVPYRLLWDNFKYFLGENKDPWTQTVERRFPKTILSADDPNDNIHIVEKGSLLNYMGIPIGIGQPYNTTENRTIKINALPLRAYCKVYNDWFKSEAVEKDLYFSKGDESNYFKTKTKVLNWSKTSPYYPYRCVVGGVPAKVNREFDYFSAGLPEPQRGESTLVPLVGANLPIVYGQYFDEDTNEWKDGTGNPKTGEDQPWIGNVMTDHSAKLGYGNELYAPSNKIFRLTAKLGDAVGASVNAIRQSFAIQKFYERQARYGTRYGEVIQGHFNTTNPDIMIDRSEYLGGRRIPISINQVVSQGNTPDGAPLGDTGGYSVTSDVTEGIFTKSFSEWGVLLGLVCTRTHRSYQQGINKFWFMDKITDMYWPEFANLGEMPIYEKEICAINETTETEGTNDSVFAYQEAWSHYRYSPDLITGELSSVYDQSLDIWHYADYYETPPTLSEDWMEEPETNVKRTLAYQDGDQFKGDFFFKATWTRPMPLYSIPGLVDHH